MEKQVDLYKDSISEFKHGSLDMQKWILSRSYIVKKMDKQIHRWKLNVCKF